MNIRDYVIITDSTTDMQPSYYKENNVSVLGMQFSIDGKEYRQLEENCISTKEFYDAVRKGSMPKTSQVSYDSLTTLFEKIAADGKDIFYLCFSGALSGSYQTCQLAANDIMEKYPGAKINIVDSLGACTGEGFILYKCVQMRNSGANLDELTAFAEDFRRRMVHLFTVDDLNHLHRGGRISKLSAVFGGMLGIKPILRFDKDGKMVVYSKARGRKNALDMMAKQMEKTYIPEENSEIFISDADARADAEYLGKQIMKAMPAVKKITYGNIGPVIGAHAGPSTIALFYIANDREVVEL